MKRGNPDQSFELEAVAREHASAISVTEKVRCNIILAGDLFFVTTSKNVQPYEKLIGSYLNGVICS